MSYLHGCYSGNPINHCFYICGKYDEMDGFAQIYRRGNKYFIYWIGQRTTKRIKKEKVIELFDSDLKIDDETYLKQKGAKNEK